MRGKDLAFTAAFTLIAFTMLASFSRSENVAHPSWIKPGATVVYYGSLTIGEEGILEATIEWTVKNVDLNSIELEATIESANLRTPISRMFKVSTATGKLLSIDRDNVDVGRFFLWLYPPPSIGGTVEIEGIPYRVSGLESVNASNRIWRCIVANSTLDNYDIRGVITRWYDVETGIQIKVYMDLSFAYLFKGENTTSSAKAALILLSTSF
ncbi:MAG: hypothetical protein RMJ00_01565 [Nitrososphaerota archaeon]|nr:hypothetical protein [Candidatus Bathyarchaeota archaeon]MDW8061374.1 hypothetical protein [Nitrososphaerota archaeon]